MANNAERPSNIMGSSLPMEIRTAKIAAAIIIQVLAIIKSRRRSRVSANVPDATINNTVGKK